MHVGADAMNGFLASMLLLHLAQTNKINREMSAYQMFRVGLDFIRMFTLIQVAAEHFADHLQYYIVKSDFFNGVAMKAQDSKFSSPEVCASQYSLFSLE